MKRIIVVSCCQISLVISNMNLIVGLAISFGEFDVSPFKEMHLHVQEAFQRWPPSDMTCLKGTLAIFSE